MNAETICPDCGARHSDGASCQDDFHQMLFWEAEEPARGVVHHLMVLCYHLQHPHLYSPDGLRASLGLLVRFVAEGATTEQVRAESRERVDSGKRDWKVTARAGHQGEYRSTPAWPMTAADVAARGPDAYCDSVRAWAQSVYEALRQAGELEGI